MRDISTSERVSPADVAVLARFGACVREKRKKAGIRQNELALKLGISTPNVSAIENGRINFGFLTYIHIKKLLGIDEDFLSEPDEDEKDEEEKLPAEAGRVLADRELPERKKMITDGEEL